jgi:hypothetical protein
MFAHEVIIINSEDEINQESGSWGGIWNAAVFKARQEIMAQEDAAIFKILDDLVASGNKDI